MTNLQKSPTNRALTDGEIKECKEWQAMDKILPIGEIFTTEDFEEIFENYERKQ